MVRLGLIGYPLQQSLSPRLFSAALQALNLAGEYRLYPVKPLPEGRVELARMVESVRRGDLDGLNVTIPHKQAVVPLLDGLTPAAQAIGAVNTIYHQEGGAWGDNTDAPGFLSDLRRLLGVEFASVIRDERSGSLAEALVLGAGGAARAVVYALWQSGWQVSVAARRLEQAQALVASFQALPAGDFPGANLTALSLDSDTLIVYNSKIRTQTLKIIINASSAGMIPQAENSPWPDGLPFPAVALVYDLIYKPLETIFLRSARQFGLPTANGLGMLVEQAVLALERWTGLPAPRRAMRQAVDEYLSGNGLSHP